LRGDRDRRAFATAWDLIAPPPDAYVLAIEA
jgi:hypothetical protein